MCLYTARLRVPAKVVLTHHNMDLAPPPLLAGAVRRALAKADAITALNEAQREAIGPRAQLIPNGIDLDARRTPPDTTLPERFAFFAGRFEEEKGVHLLLDAYQAIDRRERPGLVLAGDGRDAETVRARASELGAIVLPWLSHDRLLGVMERASLVVLPSFSEASPLLPLEAFALGVPAAVHALPALSDLSPACVAVPIGDRAAWRDVLLRAGERDPARLAKARALAEARAWPHIAARYLALYRGL